jgi:hypothetical protein
VPAPPHLNTSQNEPMLTHSTHPNINEQPQARPHQSRPVNELAPSLPHFTQNVPMSVCSTSPNTNEPTRALSLRSTLSNVHKRKHVCVSAPPLQPVSKRDRIRDLSPTQRECVCVRFDIGDEEGRDGGNCKFYFNSTTSYHNNRNAHVCERLQRMNVRRFIYATVPRLQRLANRDPHCTLAQAVIAQVREWFKRRRQLYCTCGKIIQL